MPINVNEVKLQVEDLSRKAQTTGYLTDLRFNRAAYLAQREEINYQRNQFERGIISSDSLSDLKVKTSFVIGSNGQLTKPDDYLFFSGLYNYSFNKNNDQVVHKVDIVTDSQFANRKSSELRKVSKHRPIAVEYDGYFEMWPRGLANVELVYIKNPADPIWDYTIVNGRQVYDAGGSTDFELPEHLFGNIVWRICRQLGIQVRQEDLIALGTQLINIEDKE